MTEESSTVSHLSVVMTTKKDDEATATQSGVDKSWAFDEFYVQLAVVVIGCVGTAGNALILYALVVSKEHKRHMLIVNQNALDLFSSFLLVLSFAVKMFNPPLVGASGYWLCLTLIADGFVWWGLSGSVVNLAIITIDRYLTVVHHVWSKKRIHPWMIKLAMAFAWFAGIVTNTPTLFELSAVIDGLCYSWVLYKSIVDRIFTILWYIVFFYIIILITFVYCYGRILAKIRRQTTAMASHSISGSNTTQTQSHKIQTNVIKTMIIVSAFYALSWLPINVYYVFVMLDPNLTYLSSFWYASIFVAFLYTTTNPFIYATKFDAVRRVLTDMITFKSTSSVQPT